MLEDFIKNSADDDSPEFTTFIADRTTEYEQFSVYLIYRHFGLCSSSQEESRFMKFTELMYRFLFSLGARMYARNGTFTKEDQVELVRLFSSEIEYSDENLEIILDSI